MQRLRQTIAALIVAAGFAAPAAAQDFSLTPTFGSVNLTSGFTPDPFQVPIQAGGSIDVSKSHPGCTGFVAGPPDYQLFFQGGQAGLPLIISVAANTDTTLVVNTPNGTWLCDDDSGEGALNPQLRLNTPESGRYDIWVGTYAAGATQGSVLNVSEVRSQ